MARENFSIGAFYNITKNQGNPIKTVGRDILGDKTRLRHITCLSLIEIGSKTAEKNSPQTKRHYENNGHLAVNQKHQFD